MSALPQQNFSVPIIHKTYQFNLSLHRHVDNFPKREKYSLGQKCEDLTFNFLILLLRANQTMGNNRKTLQHEASNQLDIIKIIIRMTKDIGALNENSYLELQTRIQEIGRMLGGWINKTQ